MGNKAVPSNRSDMGPGGAAANEAGVLFSVERQIRIAVIAMVSMAIAVSLFWGSYKLYDTLQSVSELGSDPHASLALTALREWWPRFFSTVSKVALLVTGMSIVLLLVGRRIAVDVGRQERSLASTRDRERRFYDMAEAGSDWLWELGPDLRFAYVSEQVAQTTGIAGERFIGCSYEEVFGDLLAEGADRSLFGHLKGRRSFRDFVLVVNVVGEPCRWLKVSGKPLWSENGGFLGFRGTGTDVTEARQAEARAEAAHLRLVRALESSAEGVALYDGAGKLILCNQHFRQLLFPGLEGLVKAGVAYRDLMTLFAKSGRCQLAARDPQAWLRSLMDCRKNDSSRVEQLATGQWIRIKDHLSPDGDCITTISDITTFKQRERELIRLAAENRQLAAAVNATEVGVTISDMTSEEQPLIFVNPAFTAMTGYRAEEVIGRNFRFLQGPETDPETVKFLQDSLRDGRPARTELRNYCKDGSVFWNRLTMNPVYGDDGRLLYFVGLQQDITEHKQAEQELRDTKEMAELASRAKSDFLAVMSHELRTPLNAVIGFSDILKGGLFGPLSDRYRSYAQDIHHSGLHLLDLINDILDLSKAEAGKIELHLEAVEVYPLVERCLSMVKQRAEQGGVRLRSELPPGLPHLRADPLRLKQVLLNLLTNAVKFTPSGKQVTISVAQLAEGLKIEVTDQGIGIAAADLPRVMEPFVQVESGMAREREGTGLGLPLSNRLVRMHDASFEITSEVGQGTTVVLLFPTDSIIVQDLDGNGSDWLEQASSEIA